MKSIVKNITNEVIINKSKFITKLIRVNSVDDVKEKLDLLSKEYNDATHICYGYIVGNNKKMSDNGEPAGTAGMPILNVLEKNDLNYILAVVIRYFGGIKLGAGGLLRAYSNSISDALKLDKIIELMDGFNIRITISYDKIKLIEGYLKDAEITYKEYDEVITIEFNIKGNDSNIILIKDNTITYEILKQIKIPV